MKDRGRLGASADEWFQGWCANNASTALSLANVNSHTTILSHTHNHMLIHIHNASFPMSTHTHGYNHTFFLAQTHTSIHPYTHRHTQT